jgi:hypothetical protein
MVNKDQEVRQEKEVHQEKEVGLVLEDLQVHMVHLATQK